jgi:hypothetical protein
MWRQFYDDSLECVSQMIIQPIKQLMKLDKKVQERGQWTLRKIITGTEVCVSKIYK